MMGSQPQRWATDDPRRLREMLARSQNLASDHGLRSVIVGVAGREGDRLLPELFAYLESALRVEDSIFHMTRERAVLFLADVGLERAREVLERSISEFRNEFPSATGPQVGLGYFEVEPGSAPLMLRDVLPRVFSADEADTAN
ncbi:MAG: hypothetical protein JSU66_17605 [Deltaproteobacteria bacterium]|nr:MAG: hypothetical protein JSU66_17605 [Deltaproteobacteria bacterium]